MSKSLLQPFAVIYPLPTHLASRILQDKKSIFVKYPTHETISPKLTSCKKLMLYISGANKEIAGEADIKSISLMTLSETILKYGSNLFLTEDELRKYSNGRDSKKMMVFELDEITSYPAPKALGHGITMVGEYISKEEYNLLVNKGDLI
ncbi:MAG: DUF365 domain-containing protein [Candidatus Methanomarinus sp.]|uniref:DUF365 domain-containing protein n=1 Tax=Candidatus Methanomarinus sp. TaxID=3386244 RepID=A0AC61S8M2_9EURY|nr:MAG: hypothetical protein C00003105_00450 [ANME-2 cluster archaeon HR1]TKY91098.1 MAG: DUF365 domain-containing protein [ANME-2 cluster archaeon]